MTPFLADEDFNNDILRGLLRRVAGADVVRVQDIGLRGASDDTVLASAAQAGRVLLTHDSSTLIGRAFARIEAGGADAWRDRRCAVDTRGGRDRRSRARRRVQLLRGVARAGSVSAPAVGERLIGHREGQPHARDRALLAPVARPLESTRTIVTFEPARRQRSENPLFVEGGGSVIARSEREPGAAHALGTPDTIPSCGRRDRRAG